MLLTVDRGNTTLDCMLWDGDHPGRRVRLDPADAGALGSFLAGAEVTDAVCVTVVEGGLETVADCLIDHRLRVVGRDLQVPLRSNYDDPATLGKDRLVTAFAASAAGQRVVVVDCGTALTVDLVEGDSFAGGVIAPGLPTLVRGLQESTPALPHANPDARFDVPASSSEDAVNAGVVLGFCAMVDGLVDSVSDERGAERVLITGGNAPVYLRHRPGSTFEHVSDLVHRGLRRLGDA